MSAATVTLFEALIDDAAVFPPGNAALADAVARHRAHRSSPHAAQIGPLLVPAADAHRLPTLLRRSGEIGSMPLEAPLDVVLIARPGTPIEVLTEALRGLEAAPTVRVVGVEFAWTPTWIDTALPENLPVVLEVPRGPAHDVALADLAARRRGGDHELVAAKFRTGATATWAWPDEAELAHFIAAASEPQVPFKLTGGLHHAVRGDHPDPQHGLLNVLAATHAAATGSTEQHLEELLSIRDAGALADLVGRWDPEAAWAARRHFRSYGCCEVTDPLTELARLGLLPPADQRAQT